MLEHVAGRVPVIVTTTHFSTRICVERSRSHSKPRGDGDGDAAYHGATIRAGEGAIEEFFRRLSDAIDIPIMIQDAPVSGTPLPAALLARLAQEIAQSPIQDRGAVRCSEAARADPLGGAAVEALGRRGGDHADGRSRCRRHRHDAERAYPTRSAALWTITQPAGVRPPSPGYERLLPLINYENRQCGSSPARH